MPGLASYMSKQHLRIIYKVKFKKKSFFHEGYRRRLHLWNTPMRLMGKYITSKSENKRTDDLFIARNSA